MSMITFKNIEYRNFLATGQTAVSIDLDRSPTTLVCGINGAGKSTFTEAIVFALFGKSYRGIPKPNLVNSVNDKDCLVTIKFSIGNDEYVVRRGIKPNIFDIEKNGKPLDNEAAMKDQQKYLEQQILKTNMKAFCQVVMLGSAAYIPFMQLNTGARREVIETLLDISVFSGMNRVLKGMTSSWKTSYDMNEMEITKKDEQLKMQQEFIKKLQTQADDGQEKKRAELKRLAAQCKKLDTERKRIREQLAEHETQLQAVLNGDTVDNLSERVAETRDQITVLNTGIRGLNKNLKWFAEHNHCTSCNQDISEAHKKKQTKTLTKELDSATSEKTEREDELTALSDKLKNIREIMDTIKQVNDEMRLAEERLKILATQTRDLKAEIESVDGENSASIQAEEVKVAQFEGARKLLEKQRLKMSDEREALEIASKLLKDSGIKAQIIKQYMPIINAEVNKYLGIMNFFVKFELDENFNETLKSRNRDMFTYNNFSMGERQRIDLALLFTWREIAKMKNSINCNLLIFDEVFDSSLDQQGVDDLFSILGTLHPSTRIFVISHKNSMEDKFRSVVTFEKVKGFTRISK